MPSRIEDYALIGDARTVALVGRDGSIDWWCAPRPDSAASFAALLGTARNGRWVVAPSEPVVAVERAYRPDTLVLETTFTAAEGKAVVIDLMPRHDLEHPAILRIVRGLEGCVRFGSEVVVRFDYGELVPWVRHHDGGVEARGGAHHRAAEVAQHVLDQHRDPHLDLDHEDPKAFQVRRTGHREGSCAPCGA